MTARRRGIKTSWHGGENGLWWFGYGRLASWQFYPGWIVPHYRYRGKHRQSPTEATRTK